MAWATLGNLNAPSRSPPPDKAEQPLLANAVPAALFPWQRGASTDNDDGTDNNHGHDANDKNNITMITTMTMDCYSLLF